MKVEVAVLDSPSLISLMVSVDIKQHSTNQESLRSCVKVEVAILDRQRQRQRDRDRDTERHTERDRERETERERQTDRQRQRQRRAGVFKTPVSMSPNCMMWKLPRDAMERGQRAFPNRVGAPQCTEVKSPLSVYVPSCMNRAY